MSQSGLPNETLHRILSQIQLTLQTSTRQLSLTKAQKAAKEREKKSIELTKAGIVEETKSGETRCFKGVGKMFILDSSSSITSSMDAQIKGVADDIANLAKKQKFLEKQVEEATGHMRDFFKGVEVRQGQQEAAAAAAS